MANKITLGTVGSISQNPTSAASTINSNFTIIQTAMDNTLSLDGTTPNSMQANLDMNNNRILNLPAGASADEPVRIQDLANLTSGGSVTFQTLPAGGTTGQVLTKNSGVNYDFNWSTSQNQAVILDGIIAESHAGGAATFAVKTPAGNDPSLSVPVIFNFPTASGSYNQISLTSALSVTIPSGGTLGVANNTPFAFWIQAINNAGTVALAVINCSTASTIFPYNPSLAINTSAISGATSAGVFYANSGLSGVFFVPIARIEYSNGLSPSGNYVTSPTAIQPFTSAMKLPGDIIQTVSSTRTTQDTFTSNTFVPTNLSVSITPTSKCSFVSVEAHGVGGPRTLNDIAFFEILRGGTQVGVGKQVFAADANFFSDIKLEGTDAPGSTGSLTYAVYIQGSTNGDQYVFPASSISGIGAAIVAQEIQT